MAVTPRLFLSAALGAGSLLLAAGCGEDATGARTTLQTVQNTSYVVQDPVTTTTTSTLPSSVPEGQTDPREQIYTVVAGDSLSKIASLYDITLESLINYNGWADGLNHLILAGDQVKIPPGSRVPGTGTSTGGETAGGGTGESEVTPPGTTTPAGVGCTHTIVEGDNPTRVANKYDITVEELQAANATNPVWSTFLIGSQLTIPPNGSC